MFICIPLSPFILPKIYIKKFNSLIKELNRVYNIYMYTLQCVVPYIKILVISSVDLITLYLGYKGSLFS